MRMPWSKSKGDQLELLDAEPDAPRDEDRQPAQKDRNGRSTRSTTRAGASNEGRPLDVPLDCLDEDPNNPRTEFPGSQIDELADDIRERGILEPIVVHPVDAAGRYRIHFGAKRLRAARRAGLAEVPVVVRDAPADPYAQVAENQKKAIAVSSATRSAALPEVPTFIESGVPGFVVDSWVGVLAPAKTARPVIERLQREIAAVLATPEIRDRCATLGIDPSGNTPDQFGAQLRADHARWEKVVKQAQIRLE